MNVRKLFDDRNDAGRLLATQLQSYRDSAPLVLGLPRGGVPVAYEVARALDAPLDVCVVRKIGAPLQPELGVGAVAEDGAVYVNRPMCDRIGISDEELAQLIFEKQAEVEERVRRFRHGAPPIDVRGKTVIVVDDGIATGGTARAALKILRARGASKLVLAVPVGASDTLEELALEADELVCPHRERAFFAVGLWYRDFTTTTDDDVVEILERARSEHDPVIAASSRARSERVPTSRETEVRIDLPNSNAPLVGDLAIPANARGLVLFAHGSGSSRRSTRNRLVAGELQSSGLATLLFDLLTEDEARIDAKTRQWRFDIDLLAARLVATIDSVSRRMDTAGLPIGYFGASTGAAAALIAASERPQSVHAVVSRGGRPDLAKDALARVVAPTLLIVGSLDEDVLALNNVALDALTCQKDLAIVPGATHLFEEPGTLEQVAHLAAGWFVRFLAGHALEVSA